MPQDTAILIIDVQRALCEGRWATHDAGGVIARLNLVTAKARHAGVVVVLVQHEAADGELTRTAPGWELAAGLKCDARDWRVFKRASDCFHDTDLHARLQAHGVRHLVVGGMQSDFCVDSGVRRALALGYRVTLIEDGHTTRDNAVLSAPQITRHHTETLCNLSSYGVRAVARRADQIEFPL